MTTPPSRSSEWPIEVRRYLTHRLLSRMLQDHDGWHGLVQWLYAGTMRNGERLPLSAKLDWLWPMIEADAAAWDAERTKGATP